MKTGHRVAVLGLGGVLLSSVFVRAESGLALAALVMPRKPAIRPIEHIQSLAFGDGETVHFQFGWNGLPAAEMAMTVRRETQAGRAVYRYSGKARTLPHIRWIYPLTDSVEAILDATTLSPLAYALYQDEKGVRTTTTVLRHVDGALRGEKKVDQEDAAQKSYTAAVTHVETLDPVSVAYLARSIPLEVGKKYSFRVFDGRYEYLLTFSVDARQKVKVKAGSYRALRITPSVENLTKPDNPRKIKSATLWISDDAHRVPLRMESQVLFGKVYGELVGYSRGTVPEVLANRE